MDSSFFPYFVHVVLYSHYTPAFTPQGISSIAPLIQFEKKLDPTKENLQFRLAKVLENRWSSENNSENIFFHDEIKINIKLNRKHQNKNKWDFNTHKIPTQGTAVLVESILRCDSSCRVNSQHYNIIMPPDSHLSLMHRSIN